MANNSIEHAHKIRLAADRASELVRAGKPFRETVRAVAANQCLDAREVQSELSRRSAESRRGYKKFKQPGRAI